MRDCKIAKFAAESNHCCCYLHSKEKNHEKCTLSFDRNETAELILSEIQQNNLCASEWRKKCQLTEFLFLLVSKKGNLYVEICLNIKRNKISIERPM